MYIKFKASQAMFTDLDVLDSSDHSIVMNQQPEYISEFISEFEEKNIKKKVPKTETPTETIEK